MNLKNPLKCLRLLNFKYERGKLKEIKYSTSKEYIRNIVNLATLCPLVNIVKGQ